MATVASVMDKAARECRITPPSNWITATQTQYMEMKDFLADTIEELQDRVDWPSPIAVDYTVPTDGSETYALPPAFKRLTRDTLAVYENTRTRRACVPVPSNGAWTYLKAIGSPGGNRYFRITGDEDDGYSISLYANPSSGDEIVVSYISKNWLRAGSTAGDTWSDTTDDLLLPALLVRLGVVWRTRRKNGLAYADRLNEYEANLARRANDARVIRTVDMSGEARTANPFDIPVPDFIPPS